MYNYLKNDFTATFNVKYYVTDTERYQKLLLCESKQKQKQKNTASVLREGKTFPQEAECIYDF